MMSKEPLTLQKFNPVMLPDQLPPRERPAPKKNPMAAPLFYQEQRLGIFVDGASIYAMSGGLGKKMNFSALINHCAEHTRLVRAAYYTCTHADESGFDTLTPVLDYLEYNGWHVTAKAAKEFTDDVTGAKRKRASIAVDLALDLIDQAANFDHILLITGDSDQVKTVEALQRRGVFVTVCGTIKGEKQMMSDELRRQADRFVDIADYTFGNAVEERKQNAVA